MRQKHRGEVLKSRIEESGVKISTIVKVTKIPKSTLYRLYTERDVSFDHIIKVAKVINWNFIKDFPEFADLAAVVEESLSFKAKYFDLLEKYTLVMEERAKYNEKK